MDNTSGTLPTHDSWSALQIPNSTGMGTLSHTTNSTSNSRWAYLVLCCTLGWEISTEAISHSNPLLSLVHSQYPSLWSVAGTTLTPSGSASGSIPGGLTSQFLRGSSYTGLTSSLPVSSPSPMYDPSLGEVGVGEAQFESSIARLTASWTPVAQTYWAAEATWPSSTGVGGIWSRTTDMNAAPGEYVEISPHLKGFCETA